MRLLTPAIKYWVCKSAPGFLYEAMECLGGNGYVEEGILARHYRESPVNAIWEGSGNVMCLDVLRALSREVEAAAAVLQSLAAGNRGPAWRRRCGGLHRQGLPQAGQRARGAAGGREAGAAGRGGGAQPGLAASRRIVRERPGLPGITPACTAPSIFATTISGVCWSGRCLIDRTIECSSRHGRAQPSKDGDASARLSRPSTSFRHEGRRRCPDQVRA